MKKLASLILSLLLLFSMPISALAHPDETPMTSEQIESVLETNILVKDYMTELSPGSGTRAAPKSQYLSVTPIQQSQTNYCGPASALMVARYLSLVSSTYTQGQMATTIGTGSDGSSSNGIVAGLNALIQSHGYSYSYQVANTSYANFSDSIIYTLDAAKPMIFSVKQMPLYYSSSGHFIVLNGYYATGSTATTYRVQTVDIIDCHWNNAYYGNHNYTYAEMLEACNSNAGKFIRLS